MSTFEKFVGIPWADKGSSFEGCNCWGLVALVYRECLGITLPLYSDEYVTLEDKQAIAALIEGHKDDWVPVPDRDEKPFDGVLMASGGVLNHIGIVVGKRRFLHIRRGSFSGIERYHSFKLSNLKLAGFFRYEASRRSNS